MKINTERFRANLVLENVSFPHEETWKKCEIISSSQNNNNTKNNISLHFAKNTDRCEVPTMNPETGRRHPQMQPTATLRKVHGAKHPWQIKRYARLMKEVEEKKKNGVEVTEEEMKEIKAPVLKAMFGIEMFHENNGVVRIGDEIIVKEKLTGDELLQFE